jgi:hypothetical protein
MIAVLPSAERPTEKACLAFPSAPMPTSLLPCWVHTPLLRVKIHAAPVLELSYGEPKIAVLPSAERATEAADAPTAPVPTNSSPCWIHTPLLRVNTHAAAKPELALPPPTIAVLPSAERATEPPSPPWSGLVVISLSPCWVHTPFLRAKAHVAPLKSPSSGPPMSAVSPSAETATE